MPAATTKKWGRGRDPKAPDHPPFRDHVLGALVMVGLEDRKAARAIREAVEFLHDVAPGANGLWSTPMFPTARDRKALSVLMMALPDWALDRMKYRRKPKAKA